jgi:hypothetical protein
MKKGASGEGSASVNVPSGARIKVRPHPKVGLEFNRVDIAGTAIASPVTEYPQHPDGPFIGDVFDIRVKAKFSGVVTVELPIDGKGMTEAQKQKLRVYRNDLMTNSVWVDITFSIDTKNNIAYGVTDHFSVFGVR